jgi:hypothetical protein
MMNDVLCTLEVPVITNFPIYVGEHPKLANLFVGQLPNPLLYQIASSGSSKLRHVVVVVNRSMVCG